MTISVYRYSLPATLGVEPKGCPTPGACSCLSTTEEANAIRNAALEEAAKVCDARGALLLKTAQGASRSPFGYENTLRDGALHLASYIRSLKTQEDTP